MKPDELGRAIDALAGDNPSVDDALTSVTRRARHDRFRNRAAALGVILCILALAAVGVNRYSRSPAKVFVHNPAPFPVNLGNVADFAWDREATPRPIRRIVTANGHTYALGTSDAAPTVYELHADGRLAPLTAPVAAGPGTGSLQDLVAIRGSLIAVGAIADVGSRKGRPAAWRSTDDGRSWHPVPVDSDASPFSAITVAVVSKGTVYAIGNESTSRSAAGALHCPIAVWRLSADDPDVFRRIRAPETCGGPLMAASGPSGLVIATGDNATAWHEASGEWIPRSIAGGLANTTVSSIAADEHGYVAVGDVGPGSTNGNQGDGAIWWSADGRAWSRVVKTAPATEVISVAHSRAGWLAVGSRNNADVPTATDAVIWTSSDGRTWRRSTCDAGAFEQFAVAEIVGATNDGFAIAGIANITVDGPNGDLRSADTFLWVGSNTPPTNPDGNVEGTMIEVGGPGPGINRRATGSLTATSTDGRELTAKIASGGRFSIELPPGTYNVVGHSPLFGDGKYDCTAGKPVVVRANSVAHVTLVCSLR